MGLAISIVSTSCKEKVWYHSNCRTKGKNGSCVNTKDIEQGGCTIWYDEDSLLKEVEGRLKQKIDRMALNADGSTLELPPALRAMHLAGNAAGGGGGAGGGGYGEEKGGDGSTAAATEHFERLRPTVEDLARIEVQCQRNWLNMKTLFAPAPPGVE